MREFGRENKGGSVESSVFDTMLVRGIRVLQKLQSRNTELYKDRQDLLISFEVTKDIAQNILSQALLRAEQGKHNVALQYLSALSDYPDAALEYEVNEQKINKVIKECYKSINIRQAYNPFYSVQADDKAQNSRKMAQKLLKEFGVAYRGNMNEASTLQIVKIMEKYAKHGWMIADTYNSLIDAFGKKFDEFSFRELASFAKSLGEIGLRQQDIISESLTKIEQTAGKSVPVAEGAEAAPSDAPERSEYQVPFKQVIVPFLQAIVNLDLANDEGSNLIERLTNDDFVKRSVTGSLGFAEQALRDQADHDVLLAAILKGRLDEKDAKFKDLAEKLVEKLNEQDVNYSREIFEIYQALNIGKSPLTTEFKPKNLANIKASFDRETSAPRKESTLYQAAKVKNTLEALGYDDVTFRANMNGYSVDFYSAKHNTVFLTLDSETLCYDRKTTNGAFKLKQRIVQSLPGAPKVRIINVFDLNLQAENGEKVKYV